MRFHVRNVRRFTLHFLPVFTLFFLIGWGCFFYEIGLGRWVVGISPLYATEAVQSITGSKTKDHGTDILIEVRENAQVNHRKYTLGEIADIDAPALINDQLASIPMGFAPSPGKVKAVQGRRIQSKVEANRIFSSEMTLWVPDQVYVERVGQSVDEARLRELFEAYVDREMQKMGFDYAIREFSIRGLDLYPEGTLSLSEPLFKGKTLKGRVTLYLNVAVDGEDQGRISLTGWVDLFDDVVCLTRPLSRGSRLTAADLKVERMNVTKERGATLRSVQNVVGKVLTRSVRRETPLTMNMISEAPLLKKGDMVTVVASRGNLKIVTLGIAKEDGKSRETIRVENIKSGKVINAVVAGESEVHVFY